MLLVLLVRLQRGVRWMKSWKQYYCGMWTEQKQDFPYWKKKKKSRASPPIWVLIPKSNRSGGGVTAGWVETSPFSICVHINAAAWPGGFLGFRNQNLVGVSISHLRKRTRSLTVKANEPTVHWSCLHHFLQRGCSSMVFLSSLCPPPPDV